MQSQKRQFTPSVYRLQSLQYIVFLVAAFHSSLQTKNVATFKAHFVRLTWADVSTIFLKSWVKMAMSRFSAIWELAYHVSWLWQLRIFLYVHNFLPYLPRKKSSLPHFSRLETLKIITTFCFPLILPISAGDFFRNIHPNYRSSFLQSTSMWTSTLLYFFLLSLLSEIVISLIEIFLASHCVVRGMLCKFF